MPAYYLHLGAETLCYYCDGDSSGNTGGPYSYEDCIANVTELNAGNDCQTTTPIPTTTPNATSPQPFRFHNIKEGRIILNKFNSKK